MRFDLSGSPVVADIKVMGIHENVEVQAKILSSKLDPVAAWSGITALFQRKKEKTGKDVYDHTKDALRGIFPKGQQVKDFLVELHYLDGLWEVQKLDAKVYDGAVSLKGTMDFSSEPLKYKCESEIKGLDLDSFLNRAGGTPKMFEGSLTLGSDLEGTGWGAEAWRDSLKGYGKFNLTNGKAPMFDISIPLSVLGPFSRIGEKVKGLDSFEQMDFGWSLAGGKISIGDFLIKGPGYVVDGEGTLDFDGLVNFRWDVFLPTSLAAGIFPDMAKTFLGKPQAHLGPIPVLVSGLITEPELKPDPAQAEELIEKIEQRKAKSLLYELVLE